MHQIDPKKVRFTPFIFLSLFFLLSCSSDDEQTIIPTDVESIELSSNNLTITQLDTAITLNISAVDVNKDAVNLSNTVVWQSTDESVLSVDNQGRITVFTPGKVSVTASYGDLSDSIEIEVNESGASIGGQLFYEDRKYGASGFYSTTAFNEVRFVTVDLLDAKGRILDSSKTDSKGMFQFGHVIPDEYSIRALAEVEADPAPAFSIRDLDKKIYAVNKASVAGQTDYEIKILRSSVASAAFNMLDLFVSAAEYSKLELQVDVSDLTIFWQPNSVYGSYYCSGFDGDYCENGRGIYVLNLQGDTDEYDDDVLLHEFGHFVMDKYFVDDSPAGCHFITDNDMDLTLAWSEGWGTFFASAVKSHMKQVTPDKLSSVAAVTSYVDTDGNKNALISYDITRASFENASLDSFNYASSEFAVSNILWSVYQSYRMEKIRDVLANYFPVTSQPANLPTFWQGLLKSSLFVEEQLFGLNQAFADRKVFYQQDTFEDDDTIAMANLIQVGSADVSDHYLYKDDLGKDIDMFAFDVQADQSYVVATSELRNGIDTYIRIFDENGNIVVIDGKNLENDDVNPGAHYGYDSDPACQADRFFNTRSALASSIGFTANVNERLYVEVSHINSVSDKSSATGPYGTYRLKVSLVE